MNTTHHEISKFCAELGKDRLLVQGAGGNVSWKEDGVLWIKGSGTWLANADRENIFVPVNFNNLKEALLSENFYISPPVLGKHKLRPSIETILHALMPQRIVVHLHEIYSLSHLVIRGCQITLEHFFKQSKINSVFVGYRKPGPELAREVFKALIIEPCANVVLLQNHGIVIGANDIGEVHALIKSIRNICSPKYQKSVITFSTYPQISPKVQGYLAFNDTQVHELACNPSLYKRLQSDWTLYPDHIVFLGPKAFTYSSWADFLENNLGCLPELIFIENIGVFVTADFNLAKSTQLVCYYDVVSRIAPKAQLNPLASEAIYELLNWDAEWHRKKMSSYRSTTN